MIAVQKKAASRKGRRFHTQLNRSFDQISVGLSRSERCLFFRGSRLGLVFDRRVASVHFAGPPWRRHTSLSIRQDMALGMAAQSAQRFNFFSMHFTLLHSIPRKNNPPRTKRAQTFLPKYASRQSYDELLTQKFQRLKPEGRSSARGSREYRGLPEDRSFASGRTGVDC